MKILHVITSLSTGGAERLLVDLVPNLINLNNNVEIAVFDGTDYPFYKLLYDKGIKIHSFGIGGSVYNPLHIIRLISLLKKERYDIVHTHNVAPQYFGAVCSLFSSCIYITTEHNTTDHRRDYKIFKYLDRWMYGRYSKVICISDKAKENLTLLLGRNQNHIVTIYNGIDTSRFLYAVPNKELRNEYKDCFLGIMVAAFRKQKDYITLIKAYSLLPDKYHLLIVGSGNTRHQIEKCITNHKLCDRIHLLGCRNDIPSLLKTVDVVILSSHYEGLSLSSIEGMASGNPFICTDVDGLHEIANGVALMVPHEDSFALANAIKEVCENIEVRNRIVNACIDKAKQYDIRTMANQYNEIYLSTK